MDVIEPTSGDLVDSIFIFRDRLPFGRYLIVDSKSKDYSIDQSHLRRPPSDSNSDRSYSIRPLVCARVHPFADAAGSNEPSMPRRRSHSIFVDIAPQYLFGELYPLLRIAALVCAPSLHRVDDAHLSRCLTSANRWTER